MIIRPACENDADLIVKLIQQSFDKNMLNSMIYGCHGMGSYVRRCISIPETIADTFYVVAEDAGHIVGCIELRFIGRIVFLNYICTSACIRTKGLGRELLRKSIQMINPSSYDKMNLDVFHDNLVAKSWYEKLGFTCEYSTNWWSIPFIAGERVDAGKISGLAQAEVCQSEFGFSQFSLNTAMASYVVGRLGRDWFRICQESLLTDEQALATLGLLDPDRKILGLFNESANLDFLEAAKPFCRSARMTVGLDLLIHNLST